MTIRFFFTFKILMMFFFIQNSLYSIFQNLSHENSMYRVNVENRKLNQTKYTTEAYTCKTIIEKLTPNSTFSLDWMKSENSLFKVVLMETSVNIRCSLLVNS